MSENSVIKTKYVYIYILINVLTDNFAWSINMYSISKISWFRIMFINYALYTKVLFIQTKK